MYRQLTEKKIYLYCPMWPCDRECGRFHERFIATTKLRRMRTISESLDQGENSNHHENPETSKTSIKPQPRVFEEIMERAAKKNSRSYEETPLPPLPEELKSMVTGNKKRGPIRQSTKDADTTMIFFDNPVWDDAKFRKELLDSDEEDYLLGDPPSNIDDDDDGLDEILRTTKHELSSNPIAHYQMDETILYSDEDDYSNLDLSKPNDYENLIYKPPENSETGARAEYEKSLDETF